jgi:hypothetical protein
MRPTLILIGFASLIALASCGQSATNEERLVLVDHGDMIHAQAEAIEVAVLRYEPVVGDVPAIVTVTREEFFAGAAKPHLRPSDGNPMLIAHSSGGMPG